MQTVLRLRGAGELFEQPARSPLDDDYESWCVAPGAEYLAQVLRGDPIPQVVLELPRSPAAPSAEQVAAAVGRYCDARVDELDREIGTETRRALVSLVPTGIIFVATLGLSRLAAAAGSDWLNSTISEALVVIGWVVLWAPVGILGTDIWALRGRRRAYRRLRHLELDIRMGPPAPEDRPIGP
jgi:hypothetical protein